MNKKLIYLLIIILIPSIFSITFLYFNSRIFGKIIAFKDILINEPKYLIYGEKISNELDINKFLFNNYKIKLKIIANCEVTQRLIDKCESYNSIIVKKYKINEDEIIYKF